MPAELKKKALTEKAKSCHEEKKVNKKSKKEKSKKHSSEAGAEKIKKKDKSKKSKESSIGVKTKVSKKSKEKEKTKERASNEQPQSEILAKKNKTEKLLVKKPAQTENEKPVEVKKAKSTNRKEKIGSSEDKSAFLTGKSKKRANKDDNAPQASKKKIKKLDGMSAIPVKVKSSMSPKEAVQYRKKFQMTVSEPDSFAPLTSFSDTGVDARLLKCCESFSEPTPIQSQCWPVVLNGRDCVAIAETGSGKTLGFGLPLLSHVLSQPKLGKPLEKRGPLALVIAPTRELALQSHEVLQCAGKHAGLRSVCVYGGGDRRAIEAEVRKGVHVIVATPGRLLGMLREKSVSLARVRFLVLDEADRMLDMGFVPDVRALVKATAASNERQTMMFSATWPEEVEAVGAEFLRNPVRITIGSTELAASASVQQIVEVLEPFARDRRLDALLKKYHDRRNKVIVFVLYKKEAVRVEHMLTRRGWNCVAIHGDKTQQDRFAALNQFREGTVPVLVATDVAARGLDIPNVEVVLNYSFPLTIEDYVHRIGRTGRAGKSGLAHTMFTHLDKGLSGALYNVLREAKAEVPAELLKFGTAVKKKQHSMYGDHFRAASDDQVKPTTHVRF